MNTTVAFLAKFCEHHPRDAYPLLTSLMGHMDPDGAITNPTMAALYARITELATSSGPLTDRFAQVIKAARALPVPGFVGARTTWSTSQSIATVQVPAHHTTALMMDDLIALLANPKPTDPDIIAQHVLRVRRLMAVATSLHAPGHSNPLAIAWATTIMEDAFGVVIMSASLIEPIIKSLEFGPYMAALRKIRP